MMIVTTNKLLKNNITRKIIKFLYKEERKKYKFRILYVEFIKQRCEIMRDLYKLKKKLDQRYIKSLERKTDRELLLLCAENQIRNKNKWT